MSVVISVSHSVVRDQGLILQGSFNKVHGQDCTIYGDHNCVYGMNCVIRGDFNQIYGCGCVAHGDHNTDYSGSARMYGDFNVDRAGEATVINLVDDDAVVDLARSDKKKKKRKKKARVRPEPWPDEPAVEEGEDECCICSERSIKTVVVPCGHRVMCVTCASEKELTTCPLCRKKVEQIIRTY